MSDRPIQVGDLVQVVRTANCGCIKSLGLVFQAADCRPSEYRGCCIYCKSEVYPKGTSVVLDSSDGCWVERTRLKRIPPLDELESVQTDEKVKVSA